MIKKAKRFLSQYNMLFLFSANIFFVILLVLTVVSAAGYAAYRLGFLSYTSGYLTDDFIANPIASSLILFLILSIAVGISVIIGTNATILRPMREMIGAMKKLADGNFDVRVNLEGRYYPQEIHDFSQNFNMAAQELSGVEMLRKDFINDFSHEFKTPIVSLGGFARLMLEGNLSKEEREDYLRIIVSEADRLAILSTNVLNLTKVEAQTIVTGKSTFNAGEQIRRAVLMMETKWFEKELELDLDIGEVQYFGNAELLNQVWVNVLDNAIKFSPRGAGLAIKLFEFYDTMVFKVKDNGPGMDEQTLGHIFDKFFQGDSSRTTAGNGLGLAVVKKIVSLHSGQIEVESRLGEGTTVTVVFPKHGSDESL